MKSKYPLLKFLFYLLVGLILGYLFNLSSLTLIIISSSVLLFSLFTKFSNSLKYTLVSISIGLLLFSNISLYTFKNFDNSITNSFDGVFEGEVTEVLSSKEHKIRFIAEGKIHSEIFKKPFHSKVIFTANDKENKTNIIPGTEFITNAQFRLGQPKILKDDFNEKEYLISKKARFFGLIGNNNFATKNIDLSVENILYRIRSTIKHKINSVVADKEVADIMIALTTGDKSGISKYVQNNFSITGTAHILAISGLHVGIFSMFIFVFIGFIKNRYFKLLAFIILIWLFVLLTGGQPSTVRAAIMATVFSYFIYYGKYPNPINILIVTFVIFIIIQPTALYSISFQLSFLAITGIILLYKPIYTFLKMIFVKDNSLTRFISSSFAISFAATILTSFLTAYYFNSFSYIYPLSNIFILLLMTFATIQCLLFVVFSSFSISLASLFAKTAYISIDISMKINEYFAQIGGYKFNGEDLIKISVVSSVFLIYLFTSNSFRNLGFRAFIITISTLLLLNINLKTKNKMIIVPRENYTSLILQNDSIDFILVADRKKHLKLNYDNALIDYIRNSNKEIKFLMTGINSINLNDQVKYLKNVKSDFISLNKMDSISNALNIRPLYTITKNYD